MFRLALVVVVLTAIGGCANTSNWQHPLQPAGSADEATLALAECQRYAAGTGPAPTPKMDVPAATSFTTRGTYTQYGSNGTFSATTTARQSGQANFATGYNAGASIGDAFAEIAHQNRVKEVTAACMRKQGWIDTKSPEGEELFKQALASTSSRNTASTNAPWVAAINTFVQAEAARPGGVDYRKDKRMQSQLDKYVKQLANDPKNDQQSMVWFLSEAHKNVLAWDASATRWKDAYRTVDALEAARPDGINYSADKEKSEALEKHIDILINDPAYADWREEAIVLLANKNLRKDQGLKP